VLAQKIQRLHRIHAADSAVQAALVEVGVAGNQYQRQSHEGSHAGFFPPGFRPAPHRLGRGKIGDTRRGRNADEPGIAHGAEGNHAGHNQ
jgi:hypothetical protein